MTPSSPLAECVIWATRGRTWGFRFLLDAGRSDPLHDYELAFGGLSEGVQFVLGDGWVAFRIKDPLSREDASGRTIPHEFVLYGDWAESINSVDAGVERIWPSVENIYSDVWAMERPPQRSALRHRF